VKSKYTGTWRITAMEAWESDYIHLTGPGYLTLDQEGGGFLQFGAVEAALDCRTEQIASRPRLEFTFQGFDEGDPVSGRGWATVSSAEMTGRIYFHRGEESGFTAAKETPGRASARATPKAVRSAPSSGPAQVRPLARSETRRQSRCGQPVEIRFSGPEKALLEEHTLMDPEYTDRLQSFNSGKTWTGVYDPDDLEDILGYLSDGEAHAENQQIARRLGSLSRRLNKELDACEDGD
jgi:hypothetical protein